jgi:hypothetical protein
MTCLLKFLTRSRPAALMLTRAGFSSYSADGMVTPAKSQSFYPLQLS